MDCVRRQDPKIIAGELCAGLFIHAILSRSRLSSRARLLFGLTPAFVTTLVYAVATHQANRNGQVTKVEGGIGREDPDANHPYQHVRTIWNTLDQNQTEGFTVTLLPLESITNEHPQAIAVQDNVADNTLYILRHQAEAIVNGFTDPITHQYYDGKSILEDLVTEFRASRAHVLEHRRRVTRT